MSSSIKELNLFASTLIQSLIFRTKFCVSFVSRSIFASAAAVSRPPLFGIFRTKSAATLSPTLGLKILT